MCPCAITTADGDDVRGYDYLYVYICNHGQSVYTCITLCAFRQAILVRTSYQIPVATGEEGQPTGEEDGAEDELAVPPPPREPAVAPPEQPAAYFVPSDRWRRPSDFLAHQVELFEAGETVPPGTPKEPKQITRDQLLFLAQFGAALNQVWQDEQADTPMPQREQFSFLLMGQGGSGKTAIVQQVVLPTMDVVFPPDDNDVKSSLIVCSSWAQAENISTEEHRAVSCHNAAAMRVQSLRNKDMLPGEQKSRLEQKWSTRRLLVLEEVGMISPALYNMLLYRAFHGRAANFEVPEAQYDKLQGAFGRVPLLLHLGDFLQLRPTKNFSLLDNFAMVAANRDVPAEHQMAAKLFMQTPLCFELLTTNRFKDHRLRKLMEFMRSPKPTVPQNIYGYWQQI